MELFKRFTVYLKESVCSLLSHQVVVVVVVGVFFGGGVLLGSRHISRIYPALEKHSGNKWIGFDFVFTENGTHNVWHLTFGESKCT